MVLARNARLRDAPAVQHTVSFEGQGMLKEAAISAGAIAGTLLVLLVVIGPWRL